MNDDKIRQILDKLYALHRFGIKPGLERTLALLEKCGNPHKRIRTVHVAGTNGKGAVCSAIGSVFMEAGYKTGLYTSPHLEKFNERIRINGIMISDEDIVKYTEMLLPESIKLGATFFEITTVMAFKYFADNDVDPAIIETGMGGRFDSTNVLMPLLSVITSIGPDHREYLGNSLKEIAFEKAGIIKHNTPVILSVPPDEEVKAVVVDKAVEMGAQMTLIKIGGGDSPVYSDDFTMKFNLNTGESVYKGLAAPLSGNHQLLNMKLAVTALEQLSSSFEISEKSLTAGLANIRKNTGYYSRIDLLRQEPPLVIDSSHNQPAIKELIKTIALSGYKGIKWNIIFAAMGDKDIKEILELLKPVCRSLIITRPSIERAGTPEDIRLIANNIGFENIEIIENIEQAAGYAFNSTYPVLITGSFYLSGEMIPALRKYFKGKF